MARLMVVPLVAVLVGLAPPAHAQSEAMRAEASRHFEQGLRLYNVQSYDQAITEFKAGYQIDPRAEFLYSLGQAQRMNHQCKAAIVSYEAFLRTTPAARQEAAARDQIEACRTELASAPAAHETPSSVAEPEASTAAPTPMGGAPPVQAPAPAPPSAPNGVVLAVSGPANAPSESATPLYRRWWFWALIGGGAAAGLVVAASAGVFTHTMEPACPAGRYCP